MHQKLLSPTYDKVLNESMTFAKLRKCKGWNEPGNCWEYFGSWTPLGLDGVTNSLVNCGGTVDESVFVGNACEAMRGTCNWGTGRTLDPEIK